jgi:hypothetical protein
MIRAFEQRIAIVASNIVRSSYDWLRSPYTSLLAWWIPQVTILTSLFAPVPVRTVIWIAALSWMRTACIVNAKRIDLFRDRKSVIDLDPEISDCTF